jgi:muramoyltetrapeptide carboxypeptidase
LHLFLNQNWQWPTIHGPLLDRLGKGQTVPRYARELRDLVFGKTDEIRFAKLKPMNEAARKTGNIRAQVSGGNLITLQSSIGTKVHWQTAGQILFFEELGERGYRIDRALEHFAQTGIFAKCKGVIFGDFNGGDEPAGGNKVQAVLKDFASAQKFPVLKGLQSGHAKIQRPLPFHTPSVLKLSSGGGELICSTGVSMTRAEASL